MTTHKIPKNKTHPKVRNAIIKWMPDVDGVYKEVTVNKDQKLDLIIKKIDSLENRIDKRFDDLYTKNPQLIK